MTLRITWGRASARRLERQFLDTPAETGTPVADVVSAMLAAHAQVLSAAEVSVGVRAAGRTRADVRAALWDEDGGDGSPGSLLKTHGPRGTVHLLATRELPLWSAALAAVPGAARFAPDIRLGDDRAAEVVAAVADALDGTTLTIDELDEEVVARTGPWAGDLVMPAFQVLWPRWRQVLHRAGQSGALCFGPNRGRKVTYTRPPRFEPLPTAEALRILVRRYLRAYGPATPQDFAKWLAAPGGWATGLFASFAAEDGIEEVDFEGTRAWVAAGDTDFPEGPVRGVRLLPPTSTRMSSPHSPVRCCSRAPRTAGRWRAGRPGTIPCCWSTAWWPGSGTSAGRDGVRPSPWSRSGSSGRGRCGSWASGSSGWAKCWRRGRSW